MGDREEAIVLSSCLVALIAVLLWIYIVRLKGRANAFALLSPCAIFLAGIQARFALGSLIVSLTPKSMVLEGEYRQYLVTWTYSGKVAYLWMIYTIVIACSFGFFEWLKKRVNNGKDTKRDGGRKGWFEWIKDVRSGRGYEWRDIKLATAGCLGIFFVGSCMAAVTGSMDRGNNYEYFASMAFRPEAAFIAFTRLKQVGYLLLPLVWSACSKRLRVVLVVCSMSPLLLEVIAGGRGAVLYPLVMMFLGYICISIRQTKILMSGALLIVFLGLAVPYMAAYRDSTAMQKKNHSDVVGRMAALVQGVKKEKIGYRYMALGREIYACSDGFVLEDADRREVKKKTSGFSDLNLNTVSRLLLPRWISDEKSFEKGDGASIAKRLMGVTKSTWFPCITTPADLFRRGGWYGVVIGGGVMGFVIWCLEALWLQAGEGKKSLESLVLTVLPATYVQSGLYGTVREVIWQLLWDLPKYVVAIVALGRIARWAGSTYCKRKV